ncbi:MAG: ElyC/SanA/YdcF family protein [Bdellovibrionales bacterium]
MRENSRTTYGNAQQSLQITDVLKCRDIILVTSRLHMHRSLNTFRSIFPSEVPIYPRAIVAGRYHPKLGTAE